MSSEDAERELRIDNEILVYCYSESERALSWYYYLNDRLSFPFKATCLLPVSSSPLRIGDEVRALAMASEDECMHDMYVRIEYRTTMLSVPLRQLRSHSRSRATKQAVQDWHYWRLRGYEF
jgi:hypothetical protein